MLIKTREETKYIVLVSTGTYPDDETTAEQSRKTDTKKGFLNPCFHYFVERDGNVETGRELDKFSGGLKRFNRHAVTVKWSGGKDKRLKKLVNNNFTSYQKETLSDILDELRDLYPDARVIHYNDLIKLK